MSNFVVGRSYQGVLGTIRECKALTPKGFPIFESGSGEEYIGKYSWKEVKELVKVKCVVVVYKNELTGVVYHSNAMSQTSHKVGERIGDQTVLDVIHLEGEYLV